MINIMSALKINITNKGFSLIELLAVVAIASILSITAVQILMQSQLRGTQSEAISQLRQEGDSLLDQFTYAIRNANQVTCQAGGTQLQVEDQQGNIALYELQETTVASNGASLTAGDVNVENLMFICQNSTSSDATLVKYQFDLVSPTLGESMPNFRQSFSSSTVIRSLE